MSTHWGDYSPQPVTPPEPLPADTGKAVRERLSRLPERRPAWTHRDREYVRQPSLWQRVCRSEGCASRLVWAFVAVLALWTVLRVLCAVLARGGAL